MNVYEKMREALITIRDKAHEQYVDDNGIDTVWIQDVANAALAEPRRNCDVGTVEEQDERFRRYCNSRGTYCGNCPMLYYNRRGECRFGWAQMPYEEGGGQ